MDAEAARDASLALFGAGDLRALSEATLRSALAELPGAVVAADETVVQALVDTGLEPSTSAARRAIASGGVSLNKVKITDEAATLGDWLPGGQAVLARGKKSLAALFKAS